jgi:hypothetical protein
MRDSFESCHEAVMLHEKTLEKLTLSIFVCYAPDHGQNQNESPRGNGTRKLVKPNKFGRLHYVPVGY